MINLSFMPKTAGGDAWMDAIPAMAGMGIGSGINLLASGAMKPAKGRTRAQNVGRMFAKNTIPALAGMGGAALTSQLMNNGDYAGNPGTILGAAGGGIATFLLGHFLMNKVMKPVKAFETPKPKELGSF